MTAATLPLATPAEMTRLLRWSGLIALDLETTGLDPRRARIRLLTVSDGNQTLTMDCFTHPIQPLLPILAGKVLVCHNAAFDLGFLWHAGLTTLPETICTYLLAQLLTAGDGEGHHGFPRLGLGACCQRWLKRELDKELQSSDWSRELSAEQLEYARLDAAVLLPLLRVLAGELSVAGLDRAAEIEMRALPGFVWASHVGVPFDRDAWSSLAAAAEKDVADLERQLTGLAPIRERGLFGEADPWLWTSPEQMLELFHRLGQRINTTNDAQLALLDHPLAELLRRHRSATKLTTTYGRDWLTHVAADGRVYPQWRQIGAASGRTSCSDPNMQQIPRSGPYRACIKAGRPGKVLIKADYAHLQMRIGCKHAKDEALLKVFRSGEDPHTATARMTLGKAVVSKADRQIAKSENFGLLFGMSASGLQIYAKTTWGVELSDDESKRLRGKFFQAYPGLARWHERTKRLAAKETRGVTGRRRILPKHCSDTWRLNSPVQADEADGLKMALALLWERRAECPDARPVLIVHDEIVIECPADQAEPAEVWLKNAMLDAMEPLLDPVPCEVETKIAQTWGG